MLAHLSELTAACLLALELCRLRALECCHQACFQVPVFTVPVLTLESIASEHNEAPRRQNGTGRVYALESLAGPRPGLCTQTCCECTVRALKGVVRGCRWACTLEHCKGVMSFFVQYGRDQ